MIRHFDFITSFSKENSELSQVTLGYLRATRTHTHQKPIPVRRVRVFTGTGHRYCGSYGSKNLHDR